MKKQSKRIAMLLLALAMVLGVFSGCGNSPETSDGSSSSQQASDTAESTGPDFSEHVAVKIWVTGSEPRDLDLVMGEINKLAEEQLNCTIEYNFFNSSDTQQKYMMLLSSGEVVDLIYSAGWVNYPANVRKGAFVPLDDLLPVYAPTLYESIPEEIWDATRVDGKIYMMPTTSNDYQSPAFVYREDLRKKWDCPEIVDLETMEIYMETIAENEPDMMPTSQSVTSVGNLGSYFTAWGALDLKYQWVDWRMPYGLMIPYHDPTNVTSYWESDDFREDMKMFKRWADKGFWSRSSLSSNEDHISLFRNGQTAAIVSGLNGWVGTYAEMVDYFEKNHPDWEAGCLNYEAVKKLAIPKHPTQDGMSVTITAEQPERALAVNEKFMTDEQWNRLANYGIEGTHYTIDDDGYYELIGSSEDSGFTSGALRAWSWSVDKFSIPTRITEIEREYKEPSKDYTYLNLYTAFPEDPTSYQTERAALFNVVSQYLTPIQAGLVDDVDVAIDEFLEKAKAAGLEKVQQSFTEQWVSYLEDNDIKPVKIEVE